MNTSRVKVIIRSMSPGQSQQQGNEHADDFGDEGQGHFLNLGGRLDHADHHAHAQAHAQHGQGHHQTEFNGLAAETDDEIRRHLAALLGSGS